MNLQSLVPVCDNLSQNLNNIQSVIDFLTQKDQYPAPPFDNLYHVMRLAELSDEKRLSALQSLYSLSLDSLLFDSKKAEISKEHENLLFETQGMLNLLCQELHFPYVYLDEKLRPADESSPLDTARMTLQRAQAVLHAAQKLIVLTMPNQTDERHE